jgi:uncharacterized protein YndB with AHSA1/START domain
MMKLTKPVEAVAGMLIRKPVRDCYQAFIDPAITTKFWFTKSTGRLDEGRTVTWSWEMYDVSSPATPKEIVPDEKIVVEWGEPGEASMIEWTFKPLKDGTFVNVRTYGFPGDADAQVKMAVDVSEGFGIVLCGLKAWLEHGIRLRGVDDRWPADLS